MMLFGPFRFDVDHLAFQELSRSSGYSWAEIERIGTAPSLQYVGREAETMTLPGVFHPHFKGGITQLPAMRLAASQGLSMPLITGYGFYLGQWVIARIDETQTVFYRDGMPFKVDFVIELKQYQSATDLLKVAVSTALGAVSRLFS